MGQPLFLLWSLGGLSIILGLCPKGFKPSNSLFKGAIRAYGLSIAAMAALPANSGPASEDALFGTRGSCLRSRRACSLGGFLLLHVPFRSALSDRPLCFGVVLNTAVT